MSLNYYWIDTKGLKLDLVGDYLSYNNSIEKEDLFKQINKRSLVEIYIDATKLGKWDSSLVVIIYDIIKISKKNTIKLNIDSLPDGLKRLLKLAFSVDRNPNKIIEKKETFLERIGGKVIDCYDSFNRGLTFVKETLQSLKRYIFSKAIMRKVDLQFALEDCSYKALPIVALISFMVGLILAFVGAVQLKVFGAEIFVSSLVAIAMVRIMGAVMTGIIIAGRTGASYAATIGTMQVNEEIDALKTMGIPVVDFLLLPRVIALMLMMPFLTIVSDIMGIVGGGFVGIFILGIAPQEYIKTSLNILSLTHFLVGIFHGFVFGCVTALCGCYYGVNCGRNADSVGVATTKAVVSAIVWMIVVTGILTWLFQVWGI